jgi:hypothetical protein
MAFKRLFRQLRTPVSELDLDKLRQFCAGLPDVTPIQDAKPREDVNVVGEIASLRIVPRAGSPSIEATINDGSGSLVAVWMGRRTIAGISPGRRLVVSGRGSPSGPGGRLLIFNPSYELL